MPPKRRSAPTTRSKSKRRRASELTEETAESVTTTPPPNLMTVDVQALSATISLAVTQAVQQALGQVKAPTPVTTEVVEASVQDEVSVLTEGTATNSKFTAQPLSFRKSCLMCLTRQVNLVWPLSHVSRPRQFTTFCNGCQPLIFSLRFFLRNSRTRHLG